MKKILFVTSKYSSSEDNKYLTNDLVDSFVEKGDSVKVIAIGDNNSSNTSKFISENLFFLQSDMKYV
ncbi:hypothetical protein AB4381_12165, partial [Vibrio splendidus]